MNCKCGFSFSTMALKNVSKGTFGYENYAVIDSDDYKKFLKAEVRVLMAKDKCKDAKKGKAKEKAKDKWIGAIARSSLYVGSGMVCPECKRLTLLLPGEGPVVSYCFEEFR